MTWAVPTIGGIQRIVRYLDAHGRPLRQVVEACDEHAVLIKSEQRRLSVRGLRGSP
jgi:hypothetical protein